jgi:CheY-like chemotaxis protein
MRKVLVIEDNLSIRQVLQISLSYFGWDILEAPNGREGMLPTARTDIGYSDTNCLKKDVTLCCSLSYTCKDYVRI